MNRFYSHTFTVFHSEQCIDPAVRGSRNLIGGALIGAAAGAATGAFLSLIHI